MPLHAQWQFAADAGVSHLRQAGIPESTAETLGATLDAAGDRSVFRTSVLAARATQDRWTGQGVALGSLVGPTAGAARWQLDGALSAFGQTSALPTASAEVAARVRIGTSLRGGAIGGGTGASSHDGSWNPLVRAQGDAWWSTGAERLVVNASVTRTRSLFGNAPSVGTASRQLSYFDAGASWRHDANGVSIGASGGLRTQSAAAGATRGWSVVDASLWLGPRVALVASGGNTLDDVTRGVPHTMFASVALRIAAQPHATVFTHRTTARGPLVSAVRLSDTVLRIEVHAAGASRIELMGDFTNWAPVLLERAGDAWRLERAIAPGSHRIAIRLDGGPWIVPVNLPRVDDDLGGTVGIISIP